MMSAPRSLLTNCNGRLTSLDSELRSCFSFRFSFKFQARTSSLSSSLELVALVATAATTSVVTLGAD